ncbi:hypothetical protein OAP14_01885 [Aliiglaciecola sp.]|nr:hypothetical protein [Aliiglaciecola sp.]
MNKGSEYFIGIDGGGTKCKARLEDANGNLLSEAVAGPANVARDMQGAVKSIIEASQKAIECSKIKHLSLDKVHAGLGLAGINLPNTKAQFLKHSHPFKSQRVTTDLHIACLGAHEGNDGAIVIVGTGSSGLSIIQHRHHELGGHGFVVGDKGSGAWLGKMAIAHCLETLDGIATANELSAAVLRALECENAYQLVKITLEAKPAFYATLAPLVLQLAKQNQSQAIAIVEEAAAYINKLSFRLLEDSPPRLSFIGGITEPMMCHLDPHIQALACKPKLSPESGAILYSKPQLLTRECQ